MDSESKSRPPEPIPSNEIPNGLLERIATNPPWWEDKELVTDVKRHASNPAVRAKVRDFCVQYCDGYYRNIASWAKDLVGLTQKDFSSPDVQRSVHRTIEYLCKDGKFAAVKFLTDLVPSGLDFFRSMGGMMAIESGLRIIALNPHYEIPLRDRVQQLLDLAAANIPNVFQYHGIHKAVGEVQAKILRDRQFSFLDELAAAGIKADMTDPHLRSSVEHHAREAAKNGRIDDCLQFKDRFSLSLLFIQIDAVTEGYENLLAQNAPPAELRKFTDLFPQFASAIRVHESVYRARPQSSEELQSLIQAGKIPEAQRLASKENLPRAQFDAEVRLSIRNLLSLFGDRDVERIFLRIRHGLGVSESVFQEEGEKLLRANASPFPKNVRISWEVARRIRRLSGLAADRFEEAYVTSQVEQIRGLDLSRNESISDMQDLPKKIRTYRELPGMDTRLADDLERRLGYAYLTKTFGAPRFCRELHGKDLPRLIDRPTARLAALEGMREALANPKEIGGIPSINAFLKSAGIEPVAWTEVRTEAMEAAKRGLLDWVQSVYFIVIDGLSAPAADAQLILDETRDDVGAGLLEHARDEGRRATYFQLYGFDWETFPLQNVPLRELFETKNPVLAERAKSDPWRPSFDALLKMQARSANAGHDPWTTDFFPLADRVGKRNGGLDRSSEKDGTLLVDYVATFGMMNLPNVSRIYFRLKKGPFASLPESDRAIVVELVGPKAERMGSENLINELRLLRIGLQRELLADAVPRKIAATLGEEMFLVLRGSTQWEKNDRPSEIFATWKRTVDATKALIVRREQEAIAAIAKGDEEKAATLYAEADALRETISVAPGYEETTFAVAKRVRGEAKAGPEEKEIAELCASEPLHQVVDRYLYDVVDIISLRQGSTRREAWTSIGESLDPVFDELAIDWALVDSLPPVEFEKRIAGHLEAIASVAPRSDALDLYLLEISAAHLVGIAPDAWTKTLTDASRMSTDAAIQSLASFMTQYLKEHYLNPAQDPDHVGHAPFSESLRLALERVWHAEGDATTNVLLRTSARIAEIRQSQTRLSRDTVEITLVPVQGPLRIYAGDIGDACYTSQHDEMARGEYARLKAMVFVTNRNKPKERMAGSVLFVETRVESTDQRIIVIRANNPRQNLIAQLDAESLVRQTIGAAIETAERRKIKHVGIVLDEASHASSNREEVSATYANEYGGTDPVGLVDEPETNFNGYDIWNADGEDPTVIVWTNDDPEAT